MHRHLVDHSTRHGVDFASMAPVGHDTAFIALLDAYRPSGGLARADDLFSQWRFSRPGTDLQLACWIAHGSTLSFPWSGEHWLPRFQFHWPDPELRPGIQPVLAELRPVMTPWELAQWFAEPNGWLGLRTAAELIASQPESVLQAARADRFSLAG